MALVGGNVTAVRFNSLFFWDVLTLVRGDVSAVRLDSLFFRDGLTLVGGDIVAIRLNSHFFGDSLTFNAALDNGLGGWTCELKRGKQRRSDIPPRA